MNGEAIEAASAPPVNTCVCTHAERRLAERYSVRREPGTTGAAIDLRRSHALTSAGNDWLKCVLMFDTEQGCWSLQVPGETYDYLRVVDLNEALTKPRKDVREAKCWAARQLEVNSADEDEENWWGVGELWVPARITEWRVVRGRGWKGYTPLFNLTTPCGIPARDLDPTTGAQCGCLLLRPAARLVAVKDAAGGVVR